MSAENRHDDFSVDVVRIEPDFSTPWHPVAAMRWPRQPRSHAQLAVAIGLFSVTLLSTLAAGAQFAAAYAAGHAPVFDDFFSAYLRPFTHPRLFVPGIPFAAALLGILLVHELGHFFACRYYRIEASYPYFVPAPTLIGTLGAFIRIRSPIANRRALFDMALAGPLAGFLVATPILAIAIGHSRIIAGGDAAPLIFGQPLIERLLEAWLQPGIPHVNLLLHPMGRAAWVGLFATALNLLPAGQLDGGHILYTLASGRHRLISLCVALALVPMSYLWMGWALWAVLLLAIGFRHPPLMDRWEPLDRRRRILAGVALAIFVLCFMPSPFVI
jgi:membrane-associated protease RseP (regulator of RpoE activity)